MRRTIRTIAVAATAIVAAAGASGLCAPAAQATPGTQAGADITTINLNDTTATSAGAGVSINGSVVTITAAGSYQLTGSLTDGQVIVDTTDPGSVELALNGVRVASSTASPLAVRSAAAVTITLVAGSSNSLSDGATYANAGREPAPDAALFSVADLTIGGSGALTIRGNAYNGITSQRSLTIRSGTLDIEARSDGVRAWQGLKLVDGHVTAVARDGFGLKSGSPADPTVGHTLIEGGTLDVTASKACVKASNTITVTGGSQTLSCTRNGVDAGAEVTISGGTMTVAKSAEGIEAMIVTVGGGDLQIVASDDGINAEVPESPEEQSAPTTSITISGGTVVIDSGNDGLDSNGSMKITGGTVVVQGPLQSRSGALSVNGSFVDTGGTLLAIGPGGSGNSNEKRAPESAGSQGFVQAILPSRQPAGTIVHLTDGDDNEIVAAVTSKSFLSIVYASNAIKPGASYRVYVGGAVSGGNLGGMYQSGSIAGATLITTVKAAGS